ncbi:MAG: FkbM family methyltransferase [Candidatus Accumulibacter sp.]|jgi:FkbM family methyltransferase|nr:FkbM family methyltransferase [Accumulibacter sp.]
MSVYSVSRIKQFVDCLVNEAVRPLITQCESIETVESWFEDEASRKRYRRELVFMVLRNLLRHGNLVEGYAGSNNMPPQLWADALQKVAELCASGVLPELAYPQSADWVLPWMYASIFVLEQYAYGDVCLREGDVFLDCGACCGETSIWAVYRGAGRAYAFEPNPDASPFLVANAARFGQGRITRVPFGVGAVSARMGMMRKETNNIGSAQLVPAEEGANTVPIVALDDWCAENSVKPDFLKMDIEGAEPDAIRGAAKVITAYRPKLAICLYHRLSDMWTIPTLLKRLVPEYRFWCRKNSPTVEFVLYASV